MHDGGYRIRKTDNDHQQEPFDQDQTAESLAARFGNFGIRTEDGYDQDQDQDQDGRRKSIQWAETGNS